MSVNVSPSQIPNLTDRRYSHLTVIGAGGMGIVFSAKDRLAGRVVALKSVRERIPQSVSEQTAFDRRLVLAEEFQTLAALRHPNIISVIDYGFDAERRPYFTMDLLDRPQTIVEVANNLSSTEARIELMAQALQAIAYLHRRGIVHRDLKPGNILVQNGQVMLLDFGLATVSQKDDVIVGTPAYLAPEIFRGQPATPASDLYAVGVILFQMLTGLHPFGVEDVDQLIAKVLYDRPNLKPLLRSNEETRPASPRLSGEETTQVAYRAAPPTIAPILPPESGLGEVGRIPAEDSEETALDKVGAPDPVARPDPHVGTDRNLFLTRILERLLAKEPTERYPSANALLRDLEKLTSRPLVGEPARDSFLQAARFTGRQRELSQLLGALTQAVQRTGAVWMVQGENGVGKSRLLDELRIRALVSGASVVRAQASALDSPYQLWREPIRRLLLNSEIADYEAGVLKEIVPDIDELIERPVTTLPTLPPEEASKRLSAVISGLLSRQQQPLVILMEDLHGSRVENFTILEQVLPIVRSAPLLIIGSYRNDEPFQAPAFLSDLPTLQLSRFTAEEVAALVDSILGHSAEGQSLSDFLQRETEGNPLFIIEVMRALAEESGALADIGHDTLPLTLMVDGIQRLVQRRLARIPPADYALLELAALMGRTLDLKVLQAAYPSVDIPRWLLTCSEAAVLVIKDEQWQFSHEKLRHEILRSLPTDQRPIRNRQAAEAIEDVYPDVTVRAPLLLHLWTAAGNIGRAIRYAILSGEQAYQASAFQDALIYLQQAQMLLADDASPNAQPQRARVLISLAKTAMHLNNYAEAVRLADQSLALSATATDPALSAEAHWILGYSNLYQGDPEKATRLLEQSLRLFRETGNQRGTAEALRGLARIHSAQGDYPTAIQYLESALSLSQQTHNLWNETRMHSDLGYIQIMQGALDQAEAHLVDSAAIAGAIHYRAGVAAVLSMRGAVAHFRNEPVRSREYLLESLAISREIGDRRAAADALNNLGSYASAHGQFADAEGWLAESLALYRELGFRWGIAATLVNLGHAASGSGGDQRAKAYYHEAMQQAAELRATPLTLESIAGLARLAATQGQTNQALEWIGLITNQPGLNSDVKAITDPLLADLSTNLPDEVVSQHLGIGRALDFESVVRALLSE